MKRQWLIALIGFLCLVPGAKAAIITLESVVRMDENRIAFLPSLGIRTFKDDEITQDIRIYLDDAIDAQILWHDEGQAITASGSAVEAGRLPENPQVTYLTDVEGYADYQVVQIAIDEPFMSSERVFLDGLALRSYEDFPPKRFRINTDDDSNFEGESSGLYFVEDDGQGDDVPPYPARDFEYELSVKENEMPSLNLSWVNPPDFDLKEMVLEKSVLRGGQQLATETINLSRKQDYSDDDLQWDDQVTYVLTSRDGSQAGGSIELSVLVSTDSQETPLQTPEDSEDQVQTDGEPSVDGLLGLLKPQKTCRMGIVDECLLKEFLFYLQSIY